MDYNQDKLVMITLIQLMINKELVTSEQIMDIIDKAEEVKK
ncbi:MAG: hypothetical protein K0S67_37 [Nitrososphaeraceae archaeon]|jgi:hypothetical protein|nr:hypothetical protein [Nitrososphaeraceae archaeon]